MNIRSKASRYLLNEEREKQKKPREAKMYTYCPGGEDHNIILIKRIYYYAYPLPLLHQFVLVNK